MSEKRDDPADAVLALVALGLGLGRMFMTLPVAIWLIYGWHLVPLGAPEASLAHVFGACAAARLVWHEALTRQPTKRSGSDAFAAMFSLYLIDALFIGVAWGLA